MSAARAIGTRESWPIARLGDIAEVRLGKMLDRQKHQTGARLPYLRNINVRWGTVETDDVLEMHFKESELERYGLRAGDVLVCEGGEPGRAAVWDGRISQARYQKALHRVRFNVDYEPRLFVYFMELLANTGRLERRCTGSTIKHLTREALVELPVPVPPIEEQQRIVEELEENLSRLDAGIAALKRVQANLKRYRAAVLKAACEGRLVPTEAKLARREGRAYEPASAFLERIEVERGKSPGPPRFSKERRHRAVRSVTDSPAPPDGWAIARISDLGEVGTGATPLRSKPAYWDGGTVPWVTSGELNQALVVEATSFVTEKALAETNLSLYPPGTLLVAMYGEGQTRGRCSELGITATTNQAIAAIVLTPVASQLKPYLSLFLEARYVALRGQSSGGVQPNLNQGIVKALEVAVPPLAEQHRIVAEVERRLLIAGDLDRAVAANVQRTGSCRASALAAAFRHDELPARAGCGNRDVSGTRS